MSIAMPHPSIVPIHPPFLPVHLPVHPSLLPTHPSLVPTLHPEGLRFENQPIRRARHFDRGSSIAEGRSLRSNAQSERERSSDKGPCQFQIRHSSLPHLLNGIRNAAIIPFSRFLSAALDRKSHGFRTNEAVAKLLYSGRVATRSRPLSQGFRHTCSACRLVIGARPMILNGLCDLRSAERGHQTRSSGVSFSIHVEAGRCALGLR